MQTFGILSRVLFSFVVSVFLLVFESFCLEYFFNCFKAWISAENHRLSPYVVLAVCCSSFFQ